MAGTADYDYHFSFNETVVSILDSLDAIGESLWAEAGSLLTWFVCRVAAQTEADCEEDAFLGVAILYCAMRLGIFSSAELVSLCKWIIEREQAMAEAYPGADSWLHRITPHDLRRNKWEMIGSNLAAFDISAHSPEAQKWLALISSQLKSN
jgi:hypothetical protein